MLKSFFSQKIFCLEVTKGVDIEQKIMLTGTHISIGSGPRDDLQLGAGDICDAHLVLRRPEGSNVWEYQSTDRAETTVRRGNPRTGRVRPGQWFQLGSSTRIAVKRIPAPADMLEATKADTPNEVPLPIAFAGIVGIALVGAVGSAVGLGTSDEPTGNFATNIWYANPATFSPAFDACLAGAAGMEDIAERVPLSEPDALFQAWLSSAMFTDGGDPELRTELRRALGRQVIEAHLSIEGGQLASAAMALRLLERMLPVSSSTCPIIRGVRSDVARLELPLN